MNLGTLIGRLEYGELEPRPRPDLAAAMRRAEETAARERERVAEQQRIAEERRREEHRQEMLQQHREEQERRRQELIARPKPQPAPRAPKAEPEPRLSRVTYAGVVRTLLAKYPQGLTVVQIRQKLGGNAPIDMMAALAKSDIEKSGARRHYVYRLKTNPPRTGDS